MTNLAIDDYNPIPSNRVRDRKTTNWWQRKSIRFKTTLMAIVVSTIPTIAVGSIAYYFAASSIEQESTSLRKALVEDLQTQVHVFMRDRFSDIKMMASSSIFTNPELRASTTAAEKSAALQKIQDAYDIYNSIAVFDARGNPIAKTDGKTVGNHLDRGYIQAAIRADGAIISPPRISTSSGVYSIYTASPIKDSITGQTIGFVRARMPVKVLQELLESYTARGDRYYLLNDRNEIFLSSAGEYVIETFSNESAASEIYNYEAIDIEQILFGTAKLLNSSQVAADTAFNTKTNTQQFLTFAPARSFPDLPELNWQAIIATDTALVFASQKKLGQIFIIGTGLVALGVGAIAYVLTNRLLYPILLAARAVREIGRGKFDTRLKITGADEIAALAGDINRMADQMSDFVEIQTLLSGHSDALKEITFQLSSATETSKIFELAVELTHQILNAKRTIFYQFENEQEGIVIAESAAPGYCQLKDREIFSSELAAAYYERYCHRSVATEIVDSELAQNLPPSDLEELSPVEVSLIAPVAICDRLAGLLIIHQYTSPASGFDADLEFVTQVAKQIGFAATRLSIRQQQQLAEIKEKSAREALQKRALALLQEVSKVSQGDLTIRARVTDDEIGTIADSYNSTIESLQKLVDRTKAVAIEVRENTVANDEAIRCLAESAVVQATEITQARSQVKEIAQSLDLVVARADRANNFVRQACLTIDSSDKAMNQTVAEINAVQSSVTQTTIDAQKLGESSQEISQVVNLIGRFAAQTHLLALKASIEAARAGEQGKGFTVIADEVRSLATQSAEATAEITTLVNKIQLEANEVVRAMNLCTEQITRGNELVQQTRQNMTRVNRDSNEISSLVSSITHSAQKQSIASNQVDETIAKVAEIAIDNSQYAIRVSTSIEQLCAIAEKLQMDIGKFKT